MPDLAAARAALVHWVDEGAGAGRRFLQAHLLRTEAGYRIRHVEDVEQPTSELRQTRDPLDARDIALTRDDGAHRPLKTAPNLQRGWEIGGLDGAGLWTALDFLYPAAAVHWHRERQGTLETTSWSEVADRQSGMYGAVRLLEADAVDLAVSACCAAPMCGRAVRWGFAEGAEEYDAAGDRESDATVPCPEACSLFVSFARAVLTEERAPRQELGSLGWLSERETGQLRALVEAAAGGDEIRIREGEVEDPLNQRRLRYLAARLDSATSATRP